MNVARYYDLFFSVKIVNISMEGSSLEADTRSATQDIRLISSTTNGLSTESD
jgi:hypothetical protein